MRKYVVWSYDYTPDSAGQKTMHLLCHELNLAGQEAYVCFQQTNPAWNTPYYRGPMGDDRIAIYPEIVEGNPLEAKHVVRWMLNKPLERKYDPPGVRFTYDPMFDPLPLERQLHLPAIELDLYYDRHLPRILVTYWVGKESIRGELPPDAVQIGGGGDKEWLADTLNRSKVMYTFDMISGMNEIARLCGCPVVYVPGGRMERAEFDQYLASPGFAWDEMPTPFDAEWPRQQQIAMKAEFVVRLQDFIRISQAEA